MEASTQYSVVRGPVLIVKAAHASVILNDRRCLVRNPDPYLSTEVDTRMMYVCLLVKSRRSLYKATTIHALNWHGTNPTSKITMDDVLQVH